jgi:hypothetical protein
LYDRFTELNTNDQLVRNTLRIVVRLVVAGKGDQAHIHPVTSHSLSIYQRDHTQVVIRVKMVPNDRFELPSDHYK